MSRIKTLNITENILTLLFVKPQIIINVILDKPLLIKRDWRSIYINEEEIEHEETSYSDEAFTELILILEEHKKPKREI